MGAFRPLGLDTTPVIATRRKNQIKYAVSMGARVELLIIIKKRARTLGVTPDHGTPGLLSGQKGGYEGLHEWLTQLL